MNMYGYKYNNGKSGKEVKEKEDKSYIYKDKSQKVNNFVPSLEKANENKKRAFIPSLSPEPKQKRTNFSPSMELTKESKQKRFIPTLDIDSNTKRRNFTPSLEMSEKKEKTFIPDYKINNTNLTQKKLKENLKEIVKNKDELNSNKKVILKNLFEVRNFTNQDKNEIISILSHLNTQDLIEIFGESFKSHINCHVKWDWDSYKYIRMKTLDDYFSNVKNVEKVNYKAVDFLNDIKRDLVTSLSPNEIFAGKVKNTVLSKLFGETESHIKSKISDKTEISREQLESYLANLKSSLKKRGKEISNKLLQLFEKYKSKNNLRLYTYGSVLDKHPDLNLNYFREINSKEKAYWLGWLFAEAWLSLVKHKGTPYIEWGVGCSKEDSILLLRFIETMGLNPKYIEYDKPKKNFARIRISFSRREFIDSLVKLGLKIGKKAAFIELADLGDTYTNRRLYLAFLLGYFDGDGNQGTSEICSQSKKFLEKIKNIFDIEYEVRYCESRTGSGYRLTLGAELFNEMLDNHTTSLPRKRIRLEEHHERIKRLRNFAKSCQKLMFDKENLEKLVWHMTYEEIAELHSEIFKIKITERTVKKWVYKWEINRPSLKIMAQIRKLGKRSLSELHKIYDKFNTIKN